MSNYAVTFNAYDLEDQVPGLQVISVDPYRPPTKKLVTQTIARADKSSASSENYIDKKLTVVTEIGRNTKALLEASIDRLNFILNGKEKVLTVPQSGSTRKYTATVQNIAITDAQGGHATISIEFFCSDPMGYDNSVTTLYNYPALVGGLYDFAVNFEGSAEVQKPKITITINSVTGGTNGTISIMNTAKGQSLEITRNWIPTDVLIVNTLTGDITVNGIDVDFDGSIPDWDTEFGNITYTDDFSARNFAILIEYNKRYK